VQAEERSMIERLTAAAVEYVKREQESAAALAELAATQQREASEAATALRGAQDGAAELQRALAQQKAQHDTDRFEAQLVLKESERAGFEAATQLEKVRFLPSRCRRRLRRRLFIRAACLHASWTGSRSPYALT